MVFNPLQERIDTPSLWVTMTSSIVSLKVNSPGLNLTEYTNIQTYSDPQTVKIKNVPLFFIPWVCEENADAFIEQRDQSKAKIALGHLEIAGFYANSTYQVQHGLDAGIFSQFDKVYSGHFHKKNSSGNISYLGNTYQMYWNFEDTRGFHILDLETGEVEFIPNPNHLFHKIYYNEDDKKLINHTKYRDTYVKIIVEGKSTPARLNKLIDNLYKTGVHDVKVIENFELSVDEDAEIESEDTLTTLTNYVNALEDDVNKENLAEILRSLYIEAQEV